jgi:hypothetical protein
MYVLLVNQHRDLGPGPEEAEGTLKCRLSVRVDNVRNELGWVRKLAAAVAAPQPAEAVDQLLLPMGRGQVREEVGGGIAGKCAFGGETLEEVAGFAT